MKKVYNTPECEEISLWDEDIITTSPTTDVDISDPDKEIDLPLV